MTLAQQTLVSLSDAFKVCLVGVVLGETNTIQKKNKMNPKRDVYKYQGMENLNIVLIIHILCYHLSCMMVD